MKPTTREEKEVAKLAASLRPISQDMAWKMARLSHFFGQVSILEKHKNWHVFRTFLINAKHHKRYKKTPKKQNLYFHPSKIDDPKHIDQEYRSLFNDVFIDQFSVGVPEWTYDIQYVTEQWCNFETGKIVCRATKIGFMGNGFSHWSNFEIRNVFKGKDGYDQRWTYLNIANVVLIKNKNALPKGWTIEQTRCRYYQNADVLSKAHDDRITKREKTKEENRRKKFETYPVYEFIQRGNQSGIMTYYMNLTKPEYIDPYVTALKIAFRHKYQIQNPYMWTDMINAMNEINADTHNPTLVCPEDLYSMHDKFVALAKKHRKKVQQMREMESLQAYEDEYQRRLKKYKDVYIEIPNTDLVIYPCLTVKDMYEEGTAMHHCVYSMRYYLKVNSLILFCRTRDGKREATIEINVKNKRIQQVHSFANALSKFDNEIRETINDNMDYICTGKIKKLVCAA